jgi:hypothetical protein
MDGKFALRTSLMSLLPVGVAFSAQKDNLSPTLTVVSHADHDNKSGTVAQIAPRPAVIDNASNAVKKWIALPGLLQVS